MIYLQGGVPNLTEPKSYLQEMPGTIGYFANSRESTFHLGVNGVGIKQVICIQKLDKGSTTQCEPEVSGGTCTYVWSSFPVDRTPKVLDSLETQVSGSIIDDNDFNIPISLTQCTVNVSPTQRWEL